MTLPVYAMNLASFPEMYERFLVEPLFRPWAEILIQRLRPAARERLLDLACGTGIVARLARARIGKKGRVVGIDVSPQMLAVASAIASDIEWREGNANSLPVDDGESFNIVICQQGLQFFSDKPAAVREMRRVLAPGGRLAVATWRSVAEIPFFRDLQRVAERRLGPINDQRYSYGDAAALKKLLTNAGLRDVKVETLSRTLRFPDTVMLVRMNAMALVGMSPASAAMGEDERKQAADAIVNESAEALLPYTDGQGLVFEMSTNLATAGG